MTTHSDFGDLPSEFLGSNGNLVNGGGTTENGGFGYIDDGLLVIGVSVSPRASDTGNFMPTQSSFSSIDGGAINTLVEHYTAPAGTQLVVNGSNSDDPNHAAFVANQGVATHGETLAQFVAGGGLLTEMIQYSSPGVTHYTEQWKAVLDSASQSGIKWAPLFSGDAAGPSDGHSDAGHHSDMNSWGNTFGSSYTGVGTEKVTITGSYMVGTVGHSDTVTDIINVAAGHFHP